MQTKQIVIDGIKLTFYQSGSLHDDKPVVLFGHSYLWDKNMWREQLTVLQDDYTCIATDLPAHGDSGLDDDKNYSIERLATLHAELMQTLGVERYAVIGLSVGGMWGTQLALSHPQNVTALVIMNSFVGPEPAESQQEYFDLLDLIEQQSISPELAANIATYFFTPNTLQQNPSLVERFTTPLQSYNDDATRRAHLCEIGRFIFKRDSLLDQLQQLAMPVHIIVSKEDLPRPPSETQIMKDHCPHATLSIVDDAAHISNLEQPEIVSKLLSTFLAEHGCLTELL